MEENKEIDDFDLNQAKRNMSKMLDDASSSVGMKRFFSNAEVVKDEQLKTNGQTINIYPGQGQIDQSLLIQQLIHSQKEESLNLKEQISNLSEVQNRLTGLEVVLKQLMNQQSQERL